MAAITLEIEDLPLARGCVKGNPRYQEELFRRYHRKMFGVCLRYADSRESAEDILQDAFIKVFRKIDSYKGMGSLEGWVRKVVVNTALEHTRAKSRLAPVVDVEHARHLHDGADTLSQMTEGEILKLVQELPVGYRTVFNLYAIDGYNHQEIAEALGIAEGTSKSQLARARELLRHNLQKLSRENYGTAGQI